MYRAVSGDLIVDPKSEHVIDFEPLIELVDITLRQVKLARPKPYGLRLVGDGECFHIEHADLRYDRKWTCAEEWYTDEWCDCGCGAPDPACDTTLGTDVCDRCGCESKPCVDDETWECIAYPPPESPSEGGAGGSP